MVLPPGPASCDFWDLLSDTNLDRETSKKGKWVTLQREKKECPYGKCRGSEEEKQGERESVWEAVWVIEFKLRCAKLGLGW